jgi:hypothetical protein
MGIGVIAVVAVFTSSHFFAEKVGITLPGLNGKLVEIVAAIVFFIIAFAVIHVIIFEKRSIHNIIKCDDEIFETIDQCKKNGSKDKHYFIRQIKLINLFYGEGGQVDELVKNKEVDRLYARADFLLTQITLFDHLTTCYYSLVISVMASFVCQMIESKSETIANGGVIILVISFVWIILLKYSERGQAGSYRYCIDEYERKLLLEKIYNLEKGLTCTCEEKQVLCALTSDDQVQDKNPTGKDYSYHHSTIQIKIEQLTEKTKHSITEKEQLAVNIEQSTTENKQSTTENEQSAATVEQSTTENKQLTTENEQSAATVEQSTTENEQSTTENEQSAANIEQSTTENEQSIAEKGQSTTENE